MTLAVDLAFAVLLECFFVDFLVLFTADVVLAVAVAAAGFGAGAGVACAANEAAAMASVMVRPTIVETVFVIFLSVLFRKRITCSLLSVKTNWLMNPR